MSTCWRCEKPLPEGQTECQFGCATRMSDEETKQFARCLQNLSKRRKVDWSKVTTLADVLLIISTIFAEATIAPDSEQETILERFLEDRK